MPPDRLGKISCLCTFELVYIVTKTKLIKKKIRNGKLLSITELSL